MSRTLLRACLDCGKQVRGKPRCRDCHARIDQAKRVRRPDLHNDAESESAGAWSSPTTAPYSATGAQGGHANPPTRAPT